MNFGQQSCNNHVSHICQQLFLQLNSALSGGNELVIIVPKHVIVEVLGEGLGMDLELPVTSSLNKNQHQNKTKKKNAQRITLNPYRDTVNKCHTNQELDSLWYSQTANQERTTTGLRGFSACVDKSKEGFHSYVTPGTKLSKTKSTK